MGKDCSIWYNAVIRGDVHYIKLGNKVNVQDNVMLHCTYEKFPLVIGNNVSIGHNACVHGCTIHDNVLIGMSSVVMDNCVIESNSIVAAGSVVTQGTHIRAGELWGGVPLVRELLGKTLKIGENTFLAETAVIIGDKT